MAETIKRETKLPTVDVTDETWKRQLQQAMKPLKAKDCTFFCVGPACVIARKSLPKETIIAVTGAEEILSIIERETKASIESAPRQAAVRVGEMVVSDRFHPAVEKAKAWLTPRHLDMIAELLSNGFSLEVLDDNNNVLTTIEPKRLIKEHE